MMAALPERHCMMDFVYMVMNGGFGGVVGADLARSLKILWQYSYNSAIAYLQIQAPSSSRT